MTQIQKKDTAPQKTTTKIQDWMSFPNYNTLTNTNQKLNQNCGCFLMLFKVCLHPFCL